MNAANTVAVTQVTVISSGQEDKLAVRLSPRTPSPRCVAQLAESFRHLLAQPPPKTKKASPKACLANLHKSKNLSLLPVQLRHASVGH